MNTDASVEKILTAINKHRNEVHLSSGHFERCEHPECRAAVDFLRTLHQQAFEYHQMQRKNRRQQRTWIIMIIVSVMVNVWWWFSR